MTYICGDLHGSYNNATEEKFLKGLNEDDILIVLGDFGWTWNPSFVEKFSLPCITLFIDGNHENFDILDNLEEKEMYGKGYCRCEDCEWSSLIVKETGECKQGQLMIDTPEKRKCWRKCNLFKE